MTSMITSRNIASAVFAVAVTFAIHGGWLRSLENTPAAPTHIVA